MRRWTLSKSPASHDDGDPVEGSSAEHRLQGLVSHRLAVGVARLGQPVGEQEKTVIGCDLHRAGGVGDLLANAQRQARAGNRQGLRGLTGTHQVGIRRAGIGQLHQPLGRAVPRQGQGDELAAAQLEREPAVEVGQRLGDAALGGDERQHRLHRGHDEAGRKTLAGDVGHDHVDAAVGVPEDVVEVACDHPGRQAAGGHLPAGARHLGRRQQTTLHVAGHLQLAPPELLRHQLLELQALHQVAPALGIEAPPP